MSAATTIDERLGHLTAQIDGWMRPYVLPATGPATRFYQMMAYHHGWADPDGAILDPPAPSGKRLRPALVVLTCEAFGGRTEDARGPAVAVELIHNFSLVHDDIQDHGELRHGRRTVWSRWGAAQGINVGDALFALAQVALAEHAAGHPRLAVGILRLNRTCVRLCEGQFLDLDLEAAGGVTFEAYEAMIARKTAALIACCAALGAWAANAPEASVEAAARFGHRLGVAFQLQDDLLGVWGNPKVTGKPAGDDVRSRKKALPMVLAMQDTRGADREELFAFLRSPGLPDDESIERVVQIMERAGVRERAAALVAEHFDALDGDVRAALPADRAGPILDLCARLRVREH